MNYIRYVVICELLKKAQNIRRVFSLMKMDTRIQGSYGWAPQPAKDMMKQGSYVKIL